MSNHKESDITISGVTLTSAQSMTVRVALQSFAMRLSDGGLGDDSHGKVMTKAYLDRIAEINQLLAKTTR